MPKAVIQFDRRAELELKEFCAANPGATLEEVRGSAAMDVLRLAIETLPETLESLAILVAAFRGKDIAAELVFWNGKKISPDTLQDVIELAMQDETGRKK